MTLDAGQVEAVKALCPGATVKSEASTDFLFLPSLKVQVSSETRVLDALFCPVTRAGYASRLYLSEQILGRSTTNWTTETILGRTWWTWSWRIPDGLTLIQKLGEHLRAFR
jgi:hypothetical protein